MLKLPCHPLIGRDNLIEDVSYLPSDANAITREADSEITGMNRFQCLQKIFRFETVAALDSCETAR